MSTVLDALRKLQREREAKLAPLEQSVTDLISLTAHRRRSVLPWVGAATAALLTGAAVAFSLGSLPDARLAAASRARASAPLALTGDELELSESFRRVPLGLDDIELAAGPPDVAAARSVAPSPRAQAPPAAESGTPETGAAEPAAPEEPAVDEVIAPIEFPEVRVVQIRWHPEAVRREAHLRVADQPELVAREGDIVAGLLVSRIDPDAVELRIGSETKISQLGR